MTSSLSRIDVQYEKLCCFIFSILANFGYSWWIMLSSAGLVPALKNPLATKAGKTEEGSDHLSNLVHL